MGMVLTENLKPGMKLCADVHDRNGRMLLGAGTELTEKHIYIFHTWGVVEADISGLDQEECLKADSDSVDQTAWEAAEALITPLFRHTDLTHPMIKRLLSLSIMRRARN